MKKIIKGGVRFLFLAVLIALNIVLAKGVWDRRAQVVALTGKSEAAGVEVEKILKTKPSPVEENFQRAVQQARDADLDYILYTTPAKHFDLSFTKGNKPRNEVDFYFLLMSYLQFLADYAEKSAVTVAKDFAYGFEAYRGKDVIPERDTLDELYQQSKILTKLLTLLFDSNDYGMELKTVTREAVQTKMASKNSASNKSTGTKTSALRSQDWPSYLFSLDFSCYTSALRNFLNRLEAYNLPVIIRNLKISTNEGSSGTAIMTTNKAAISMTLEWVFVKNPSNKLQSQTVEQE